MVVFHHADVDLASPQVRNDLAEQRGLAYLQSSHRRHDRRIRSRRGFLATRRAFHRLPRQSRHRLRSMAAVTSNSSPSTSSMRSIIESGAIALPQISHMATDPRFKSRRPPVRSSMLTRPSTAMAPLSRSSASTCAAIAARRTGVIRRLPRL